MKNVMFFDPALSGHHPEYLKHIINYVVNLKDNDNYYFVVNPSFSEKYNYIHKKLINNNRIQIIQISQSEFDKIFVSGSMIKRSINEFEIMNNYASQLKINQCVILYINSLQFALGLYRTNYLVYGILFGQFTRQSFPNNFKGWVYKKRKILQTMLLLNSKKLKSVFLLNDYNSCDQLNQLYKTNIFKYLPDPVPEMDSDPDFNLRERYNIERWQKIYLHTGSLEPRKGTLEIIDAVDYLSEEVGRNIVIIIAGLVKAGFNEEILERLKGLVNKINVKIIYENTFIPDKILKSIFEQIDFILIPYKNTESSSGILGHAINNKKLVIGPSSGLLGHLIKENKLGYLLDNINGQTIANAITAGYYEDDSNFRDTNQIQNYLKTNTADEFAKKILSQL